MLLRLLGVTEVGAGRESGGSVVAPGLEKPGASFIVVDLGLVRLAGLTGLVELVGLVGFV